MVPESTCMIFTLLSYTDIKVKSGLMDAVLPCTIANLSSCMKDGESEDGGGCDGSAMN